MELFNRGEDYVVRQYDRITGLSTQTKKENVLLPSVGVVFFKNGSYSHLTTLLSNVEKFINLGYKPAIYMKLFKKAKIPGIVSFIIVVLVVILLVYLIKNGWNVQEAVKDMLSLLGKGTGNK